MRRFLVAFGLCLLAGSAAAQVKTLNLFPAATLTITTGGTWQQVFPANNNRVTLWIENYCSTTTQGVTAESLFVYFQQYTNPSTPITPSGTPQSIGAQELAACGSVVFNGTNTPLQAIWVYAATTAHAFSAWQNQ